MNILNRTVLEVKIGDRIYKLECAPDSPLNEINQSLVEMNAYVLTRIEDYKNSQEKVVESEIVENVEV